MESIHELGGEYDNECVDDEEEKTKGENSHRNGQYDHHRLYDPVQECQHSGDSKGGEEAVAIYAHSWKQIGGDQYRKGGDHKLNDEVHGFRLLCKDSKLYQQPVCMPREFDYL